MIGLSLEGLCNKEDPDGITFLGSMLFSRFVSGTRVVPVHKKAQVAGHSFEGFMAHIQGYPFPYLTAAAAIGLKKEEIDIFISRLDKVFSQFKKTRSGQSPLPELPLHSGERKEVEEEEEEDDDDFD